MSVNEQLLQQCQTGETKLIPTLIVKGADPNFRHQPNGQTVLHVAAENGHLEVVQAIATRGGFPNFVDNAGQSPLHYAAKSGHAKIVQYLLDREADCLIQDKQGKTALDVAEEAGNAEAIEFLKKAQEAMEHKMEAERIALEEEHRRIQALKQIVMDKEKRRSHIPPQALAMQRGGHFSRSKEDMDSGDSLEHHKPTRHSQEEEPQPASGGSTRSTSSTGSNNASQASQNHSHPHPHPLSEPAPSADTRHSHDDEKKTEFDDVYLDQRKNRMSFFSRAKAITGMMNLRDATLKKSKAKQSTGDKGDKWLDMLAD